MKVPPRISALGASGVWQTAIWNPPLRFPRAMPAKELTLFGYWHDSVLCGGPVSTPSTDSVYVVLARAVDGSSASARAITGTTRRMLFMGQSLTEKRRRKAM